MKNPFRGGEKRPQLREAGSQVPGEEYLQRVDLFKSLDHKAIEALFRGMMVQECTPGTVFFTPEDPAERLFVLKKGQVHLYRLTPSGKRLVTRRITPGAIFGEMGLLGQSMQGCFAEATESSLVCVATRENVLRLLNENPDVMLRLLEAIGRRLRMLEDRLEQAAYSPVKVRLASFLLANIDPATAMITGYTHEEVGNIIGALRQTVTETLNEMQNQGLVEVGHKQVRVRDPKRLEEVAQGAESASR
ncbi:MAG: Crp/Fnr family transcriptional regulator [Chloroflexi bacterium]|nr:Crp/Fnr family transcriptional regulator [Chloroflexota bacterium]